MTDEEKTLEDLQRESDELDQKLLEKQIALKKAKLQEDEKPDKEPEKEEPEEKPEDEEPEKPEEKPEKNEDLPAEIEKLKQMMSQRKTATYNEDDRKLKAKEAGAKWLKSLAKGQNYNKITIGEVD